MGCSVKSGSTNECSCASTLLFSRSQQRLQAPLRRTLIQTRTENWANSRFELRMCTGISARQREARARSRSSTAFRFRQLRHTIPHSSRSRCPRLNARHEQIHHGVARTTSVSARSTKRWSSTSLLSTIRCSPASRTRCFSRNSLGGTRTQPGSQL